MPSGRAYGIGRFRLTRRRLRALARRILGNPVLMAVAAGLILSLSTIGPKWLNPGSPPCQPNCSYAIGTGLIAGTLAYLAGATEVVAFFSTGIWISKANPLALGVVKVRGAVGRGGQALLSAQQPASPWSPGSTGRRPWPTC